MTLQEFSLEFDVLFNNVTSNSAPPLDEYEKSVFLTMAQLEIVKELYSGRNQLGLAVETNEEVRQYLSSLIKTGTETPELTKVQSFEGYEMYEVPTESRDSYIAILREYITTTTQKDTKDIKGVIPVIPITQDTVVSVLNNPFKGVSYKRALKVEADNKAYIYFKVPTDTTYVFNWVYLDKPTPIILENIDTMEDLSIDGRDVILESPCKLPESLHREILMRAVQLAKQAYIGQA